MFYFHAKSHVSEKNHEISILHMCFTQCRNKSEPFPRPGKNTCIYCKYHWCVWGRNFIIKFVVPLSLICANTNGDDTAWITYVKNIITLNSRWLTVPIFFFFSLLSADSSLLGPWGSPLRGILYRMGPVLLVFLCTFFVFLRVKIINRDSSVPRPLRKPSITQTADLLQHNTSEKSREHLFFPTVYFDRS